MFEQMLRAVGDGEFPKLADLKRQLGNIDKLENDPTKVEEANKMKRTLLDLFNTPGPASRWHGDLLGKIDSAFQDHFMDDNKTIACFMLRHDDEYRSRFIKYRDAVVTLCQAESRARHAIGMDQSPSLPSRVYFMLHAPPNVDDPLPIPIPTSSFISWFDGACKLIPHAFDEVSTPCWKEMQPPNG
jgi:hypothetical protein